MSTLKRSLNGTVMSIIELVVGILLLVNPVGFTSGIIVICGIILMIWGLVGVVKYFRTEPEQAAAKQLLSKGLTTLLAGAFCTFCPHWFVATFPILTLIYGVVILFTGLTKIQWTADIIRSKRGNGFWAMISAAISIVCGIIIITSPFTTTTALWIFTGISLIVEAVFDMLTALLGSKQEET